MNILIYVNVDEKKEEKWIEWMFKCENNRVILIGCNRYDDYLYFEVIWMNWFELEDDFDKNEDIERSWRYLMIFTETIMLIDMNTTMSTLMMRWNGW